MDVIGHPFARLIWLKPRHPEALLFIPKGRLPTIGYQPEALHPVALTARGESDLSHLPELIATVSIAGGGPDPDHEPTAPKITQLRKPMPRIILGPRFDDIQQARLLVGLGQQFGLDLGDLTTGTGGGFLMDIPKFAMKGAEDVFGGDLDSPPTPVSKLPPNYPVSLLSKGIGGRVLVNCTVDEKGAVTAATVKQSSGHAELDKAAVGAVGKWKFNPATKGGRRIKASCVVPFNFEVRKN